MHTLPLQLRRTIAIMCAVAILFSAVATAPLQANAQAATVPIGTMLNPHNIMAHLKEFTLDKMAVLLANQILQRMTASVVSWINTGFEGSPAFLQNPEAFFLDAADQVTGYFLTGGTLSALCSPISLDLRLTLALSQTELLNRRYTCTLGRIIDAQSGGPNITVNGQIVRSSQATMQGFMDGDFYQGGWPAYMALTTEPQNNQYGALLMAQSDLNVQIADRQATIRADLQMGNGFMSWQKCSDIPGGTASNDEEAAQAEGIVGTDPSVRRRVNSDGTVTYQDCETQTPGSVIGRTLQKQLDVPQEKLVLVKTISDSIDAILGALVNQMLTQGLAALSGQGSSVGGDNRAYLRQLQDEANNYDNSYGLQSAEDEIDTTIATPTDSLERYKSKYDQAVGALSASRRELLAARSCFTGKISSLTQYQSAQRSYGEARIAAIDTVVAGRLDPLLSGMTAKQTAAANRINQLSANPNASRGYTDASTDPTNNPFIDFQGRITGYSETLNTNLAASTVSATEMTTAESDRNEATEQARTFSTEATTFQVACNSFPEYYSQYSNPF